jgi:hypothetical protein
MKLLDPGTALNYTTHCSFVLTEFLCIVYSIRSIQNLMFLFYVLHNK